jgi:hypothetical protein
MAMLDWMSFHCSHTSACCAALDSSREAGGMAGARDIRVSGFTEIYYDSVDIITC